MPPLPPAPGIIRTNIHFEVGSDLAAEVVRHFQYTGPVPTAGDLNIMAAEVHTAWVNRLQGLTGTNIAYSGATCTDIASSTGAQGVDSTVASGTLAGAPLSAGTAALINHTIIRRYRGGKPRTYLPAGSAASLSGPSDWTVGFQTGLTANWNLFISDILATAGMAITLQHHVNVSFFAGYTLGPAQPGGFRKKIAALRPGGPVYDVISAGNVNLKPGTQRRRLQFNR